MGRCSKRAEVAKNKAGAGTRHCHKMLAFFFDILFKKKAVDRRKSFIVLSRFSFFFVTGRRWLWSCVMFDNP